MIFVPRGRQAREITAAHPIFLSLGDTKLIAELMFATNTDTGVNYAFAVPAIPAQVTDDVKDLNERALYIRGEEEERRKS